MSFHDIRFPTDISLSSEGGPERRTEIVALGSGHEERNSRWADSRRRYNAGYGVKSLDKLYEVISFFEERRGKLYGFRWKDAADYKSCAPGEQVAASDQVIGQGDGVNGGFQLNKTYGASFNPYIRSITKPVAGTVLIDVDGVNQQVGVACTVDYATGGVVFQPGYIPTSGSTVSAGFEFDVPARFDTDVLTVDINKFNAGAIPNIPIVEVRV